MLKRARTGAITTLAVFAAAAILLVAGTSSASAAKPCKTQVASLADAESSCEAILGCSAKTPPQEISCRGRTNRWICKCVKPKSPAGILFDSFAWAEAGVPGELMSRPVEE